MENINNNNNEKEMEIESDNVIEETTEEIISSENTGKIVKINTMNSDKSLEDANEKDLNVQFTDKQEEKQEILKIDFVDYENVKSDIYSRINVINNFYCFTESYSKDLVDFFELFDGILFDKIKNTIDNNKNFLKFFNEIMVAYNGFGQNLTKMNSLITSQKNDLLQDIEINNFIQKTQEAISSNFSNFSTIINSSIISKAPFKKVKDFYERLNVIHKSLLKMLNEIKSERNKFFKRFSNKYMKMLDSYKRSYEENLEENTIRILKEYEFFLVELDIYESLNNLFGSINSFINKYKESLTKIKEILIDYINIIKETLDIYIDENAKVFHLNLSVNMDHIHQFYESIKPENIAKAFSFKKLIEDNEMLEKMNKITEYYFNNLLQFKMLKSEKNDFLFKLENYQYIEDFFDILLLNNPKEVGSNFNSENYSLITFRKNFKRDPSLFKSWKSCLFIISAQNNVIIFDEEIKKKNFVEKFNLNRAGLKKKYDDVRPFKFELFESKKGLLFNSTNSVILDSLTEANYKEIEGIIKKYSAKYRNSVA